MDIVGITFDKDLTGCIAIKTLKVSKWINSQNFSLEVIFRLTVEHNYKENGYKKLKEFCMYLKNEDLVCIDKKHIEESKREDILDNKSKRSELESRISPLKGYSREIPVKRVKMETYNRKKRIKVILDDYNISEEDKKNNIKFSLKFEKSIDIIGKSESTERTSPWFYDCLVESYLVQTLKWEKKEFMPPLERLEVWLQIPKELYGSLSQVNVMPTGHFEQMFLLGRENAEIFKEAKQPLAEEDTLCINWTFSGISVSNSPEEIEVTCGLRKFTEEDNFIKRFKTEENPILILREILYTCRVKTLDFKYIISNVSENLKDILEILNIMVHQRYLRSVEENMDLFLQHLKPYQDLPYGKELFVRYQILNTLIRCKSSKDFFSNESLSMLRQVQDLEDALDPDYVTLMQDFNALSELTKNTQYKDEILSQIENLDHKWRKLIYPDRYIIIDILNNWKEIVEKEYEEKVLLPEIEAKIKTKKLAFSDHVGVMLSIRNVGIGEAKEVYARLIKTEDYDIIKEKSEMKALLTREERPFEPELVLKPKATEEITVLYEIRYMDILGRDAKKRIEGSVDFIKEKLPFQRIENPYIVGGIVRESKMFFGREGLLENIISNFKGRYQQNSIFLYGQRRTGKTSILFHLKERLKDEFVPISFDMLDVFGKKSFFEDLMEKIKRETGFEINIPNIENDPFNKFKNEFYIQFKQKLKEKEIVIMIDEYQRIDELITKGYYDDSVIDFLSALVQDGEMNIILAGYLQPEELQNKKWVGFMRFFTPISVGFLRREDAIRLICEPVKGLIDYDDGGIEKIISLSGCHPIFVQLICRIIVDYHNLNEVNLIGYSVIKDQLNTYLDRGKNVFFDIIRAQTREIEQRILSSLCSLMEEKNVVSVHKSEIEKDLINHENHVERSEVEKALSLLERKEIIKRSAEHAHYYEFTIDLYKHWVKWYM